MKFAKILISILVMILLASFLVSCDSAMDAGDSIVNDDLVIDGISSSGNGIGSIHKGESNSKPSVDDSSNDIEQPEENQDNTYESKIIQTASLDTQTKNFNSAIAEIEKFVKELGGYIESSNITGNNLDSTYYKGRNAKYSLRIPAAKFDEFLSYAESNLHIISTTTTSTDVTVNYYDLKSRLSVLEAEKQALNQMLEKATTISDMLSIRNRLTDTISDIEAIETQLRIYDSKVNYSTITLRVNEVVEYTAIEEKEPTWWSRITTAFVESWSGFAKWWQNFSVWVVFAIPTLVIMAFFGSIIGVIVHFVKKNKKLKQKEKNESKE